MQWKRIEKQSRLRLKPTAPWSHAAIWDRRTEGNTPPGRRPWFSLLVDLDLNRLLDQLLVLRLFGGRKDH